LLASKAKADEEFRELLEEVRKTEAEEKKRAEEKRRAEEVEEKRQVVREAEETWRMEEAEARKKKAKVKALADKIMENHQRMEEAQRPSSSKAVVPWSIGGVLLSTLTAHQIASEVAQSREKMPKATGSGPMISVGSNSDLDNQECEMCF